MDLGQQLYIVSSSLRPENIIIMEGTVLWEDRIEEGHKRKKAKYDQLVISCPLLG